MTNKIVEENKLAGSPSIEWDINGDGDPSIQGFGHEMSISAGERIDFRIKTDSTDYRIDIFRMGYYGGMGARKVDTILPSVVLPQQQPEGIWEEDTRLYDCGNWAVSASWEVPTEAVSGIYFARLVRQDSGHLTTTTSSTSSTTTTIWRADNSQEGPKEKPVPHKHAYGASGMGKLRNQLKEPKASHIYFVVRDDHSTSDIIFQTSDTTWQAYNRYGGYCTYSQLDPERSRNHGPLIRSYKASYNRPFETRHWRAVNMVFNSEYPAVRWLEQNGYDLTYTSGVDSDRRGSLIKNHKIFLSVGHDEYWSGAQRRHVEAARDAGVNLCFWSGNEVFWKTRWEPSIVNQKNHRTLVCYKETHNGKKIDPTGEWTGTWRDSRDFNPEGGQPENALTGTIFTVNAWRNDALTVPSKYSRFRLWRNTDIANLKEGQQAVLLKGSLGHEWDEDIDNGFRPPGLFHLSETVVDNVAYIQDHGSVYDSGSATHHLCMYRYQHSDALIFGAGTVQWSWGLSAHHDADTGVPPERANSSSTRVGIDPHGPDKSIQQATVNLLADMNAQPETLQHDLVCSDNKDIEKVPPQSNITGLSSVNHMLFQLKGKVADEGRGCVAGIEISLDRGTSWHPAELGENGTFAYTLNPKHSSDYAILTRAVNDSGYIESWSPSDAICLKDIPRD